MSGFLEDHVTLMCPHTVLSLVRAWIHAHASVHGGLGIFPFSQFQYVSGCRQSLNDGIVHAFDFVIGGRRELGYGYGFNRRWWRPSSRVLARHRLREAEVQC